MKHPYLITRKSGQKTYFHFRSKIPQDLIPTFSGRKEFQISLKNVRNGKTLVVSIFLQTLIEELFNEIRMGMKTLTLEDIREILKVEVRKSILHSHRSSWNKQIRPQQVRTKFSIGFIKRRKDETRTCTGLEKI